MKANPHSIRSISVHPRSILLLLAMLDYLMAQNYSANTIRNYVKSFNFFLRVNQYQNPDTLTEMQIVRHLAGMTEKGLSSSSLNMLVNSLKYYYRTVLKRDAFEIRMLRPRIEHHLPTVLSMEECFRIFSFVENPKHKLLLLGHSSIKTTMIYAHITPKAAKKIVSPLDSLMLNNLTPKKIKKKIENCFDL